MFKTRKLLTLLTAAWLAAVTLTSCSSGSSDDDDGTETSTYSGTYTVNGASYNSLMLSGTADSGTATLTGSGGTQSGTYARSTGASVRATISLSGGYILTFSGNTITITFNGNSVSFSTGTWPASGTGTLVVPVSGSDSGQMDAEAQSVYNSLLGTRWRSASYVPVAERASSSNTEFNYRELIINADGSAEYKYCYEDKDGNSLSGFPEIISYPSFYVRHNIMRNDPWKIHMLDASGQKGMSFIPDVNNGVCNMIDADMVLML
ncbi:MAG: hypothetical protein K6G00_08465 [Treponema sp.]|nr:hypothetical protein [Treponema sp.]